jgi:hypothetical protein
MPQSRPAGDSDRLPWLEPYLEPPAKGGRLPRRGYGAPLAWGIAFALAIAATAGGFWLGRSGLPPPGPSDTVAIAPSKPEPVRVAEAAKPLSPEPESAAPAEPAPQPKAEASRPKRRATASRSAPSKRWLAEKRRIRAEAEASRLRAVKAAQERRSARRAWPKMPSPGPAGQVIQLGAFSHPDRAYAAYRNRIARYPQLARMPRVIVPVAKGRRGSLLYVLRLGTTSRQQSQVVCNNLRRSGDHCLVIG